MKKGFWQNSPEQWSSDGTYPNKPEGRSAYKKAIRRAIFHATEYLWNKSDFETQKYPKRPRDQYTAQIVNTLELSAPPPNRG